MRLRKLAAASVLVAPLAFAQIAGAEQLYPDPAGDAAGGSDITQVTVRNDAAGAITIAVTTAVPMPGDHLVLVLIDSDKNAATGVDGSEFVALAVPGASVVALFRTTPAGVEQIETATTRFAAAGNVVEIGLQRGDLGNTTGFVFVLATGDAAGTIFDFAPNTNAFTYDLPACSNGVDDDTDGRVDHPADRGCTGPDDTDETDPPLRLTAGAPKAVGAAREGRPFVVTLAVTRSDGASMTSGTVTCAARAGAKTVRARASRSGNVARCTMRIPTGTTGRRLRGTIVVQVGSARVSRPYSFVIR